MEYFISRVNIQHLRIYERNDKSPLSAFYGVKKNLFKKLVSTLSELDLTLTNKKIALTIQ